MKFIKNLKLKLKLECGPRCRHNRKVIECGRQCAHTVTHTLHWNWCEFNPFCMYRSKVFIKANLSIFWICGKHLTIKNVCVCVPVLAIHTDKSFRHAEKLNFESKAHYSVPFAPTIFDLYLRKIHMWRDCDTSFSHCLRWAPRWMHVVKCAVRLSLKQIVFGCNYIHRWIINL